MTAPMRTKFFEQRQYYRRNLVPGQESAATNWELLGVEGVGIDQQINNWLQTTGNQLVVVTAPGIYHFWLDEQRQQKCVVVGVVITYMEGAGPRPEVGSAAPPLFGGPVGTSNERPGNTAGSSPAGISIPSPRIDVRPPRKPPGVT